MSERASPRSGLTFEAVEGGTKVSLAFAGQRAIILDSGLDLAGGTVTLGDIDTRTGEDDRATISLRGSSSTGLTAELTVEVWPTLRVARFAMRLGNAGATPQMIDTADALAAVLAKPVRRVFGFTSSWGAEFEPTATDTPEVLCWCTRSGRSSNGRHPWVGFEHADLGVVVCPAWSGNWHVEMAPADVGPHIRAGISPENFAHMLAPGARFDAPEVVVALGADVDDAAVGLTSFVTAHWVPRNPAAQTVPIEWNHWWPYEDTGINETIFLDNARAGARLGIDVSTLDAGWFGPANPGSDWTRLRGDWHEENRDRFPSGIAALAESVRELGQQFGIWLEPEAIGVDAAVRRSRPGLQARRDGDPPADPPDEGDPGWLGYVCLGSQEGREFLLDTLDDVVARTSCVWIKWDFNLDPGAGCDRTDHGHGSGDGLWAHYRGLYDVLDEFRARHPDVMVEACSSGGLRLDLGLLQHVHFAFLSDPDWTEHHLQVLWGASLMLPPSAMLHWPWSEWRGQHPRQTLDLSQGTDVGLAEFDAMVQAAMLCRFGLSLRLPELDSRLKARLGEHLAVYAKSVRPLVGDGVLRRLTAQPMRDGRGERRPAFQLSSGDQHLLAVFDLDDAGIDCAPPMVALETNTEYAVHDPYVTDATVAVLPGAQLMQHNPLLRAPRAAKSWLWLVRPSAQDDPDTDRRPTPTDHRLYGTTTHNRTDEP